MKRLLFATLLLISPSLAPGLAIAVGLPPQLRSAVTVEGEAIHLGDLWDNLEDKAATAIVAAPQPGKHITLDARWLAAVAQTNGIEWRPASTYDRIVVSRAGQMVSADAIESELREALDMEGLPKGSGFELTNRASLGVMIPSGAQPNVAVREMALDLRTQRFSAVVEVPAGSPSATRLKVSGRIFAMARLPVLTHAVNRGDVISEKDVQWMEVREENVRRDIAIDPRELVGMEPRFQVKAGVPVRTSELQRPLMVTRNSAVTMVLRTPYMTLTAQAQAIEDGGRGDIVKVTNLQTKQIVEAKVEGPGTVSVAVGGARVLSN